jgi:hypothetical protein
LAREGIAYGNHTLREEEQGTGAAREMKVSCRKLSIPSKIHIFHLAISKSYEVEII